jgi:hypothetical protein
MYDHFNKQWIELEPTESWLQRREFVNTIKGIMVGLAVSLLMGCMTLVLILGLWGGR